MKKTVQLQLNLYKMDFYSQKLNLYPTNKAIKIMKNKHTTTQDNLEDQLLDVIRQLSVKPFQPQQKRYNSLKQIMLIVFNLALSSFYFGYSMVYLSSIQFTTIIKLYSIAMTPQVAQGLLVACVPIGGGIGAAVSPIFIQRFSRRNCLLIINCMAVIAGLMLYIMNFNSFIFARLFQGFCAGVMSSLAPLIIKELAPTQISGTLACFHQIFITFGTTFGFTFSLILTGLLNDKTGQSKWWILFAFPFLIVITQSYFLITTFKIQTPKYLLLNNRQSQARQLIAKIYRAQYVESVLKQMKDFLKQKDDKNQGEIQLKQKDLIGKQFIKVVQQKSTNNQNNSSNKLQTPRSAMISAIHLAVLQQFCGVNAVVAYGGQIVGEKQPSLRQAAPIIINLLQFIGAILASFLLTKVGRKLLLEMGALTTSIGALVVGIGFINHSLPWILVGLVFSVSCFGFTLGPVVWIYLPEVAQPKIISFATASNWGSCAFIFLMFPIIKDLLPGKNPAVIFIFFSIWSLVSFFYNRKYVIQTRNKGQKQIFQEYTALKPII